MVSSPDFTYKIVIIGDSGVGKTCLFSKCVKGVFPKELPPNQAAELGTIKHELKEKGDVVVQVCDTSGKPKYRESIVAHFKKCAGVIVVYDVTNKSTFENVPRWIKLARLRGEPNASFMILGNKTDELKKDQSLRKVTKEEIEAVATENKALIEETSVLEEPDLRRIFEKLIVHIHEQAKAAETENKKKKGMGFLPRPKPTEGESKKTKSDDIENLKAKFSDKMHKRQKQDEAGIPKSKPNEPEIPKPKQAESEITKLQTVENEISKPKSTEPQVPKATSEEKNGLNYIIPLVVLLGSIILVLIIRAMYKE